MSQNWLAEDCERDLDAAQKRKWQRVRARSTRIREGNRVANAPGSVAVDRESRIADNLLVEIAQG